MKRDLVLSFVISAIATPVFAMLTSIVAANLAPELGSKQTQLYCLWIGMFATIFLSSAYVFSRSRSSDTASPREGDHLNQLRKILVDDAYLASLARYLEEEQKPADMQDWVSLDAFEAESAPIRRAQVRIQPAELQIGEQPYSFAVAREPVTLFEELDKRDRIVLLGEPGSGKSFTVRRWLWEKSHQMLATDDTDIAILRVPIYVNVGEYRGRDVNDKPEDVLVFLRRQLQKRGFSRHVEPHLEMLLRQGKAVVVFDGLNSLPAQDYYQRLDRLKDFATKEFPLSSFVFTCRTLHHDEMLSFDTFMLLDLSDIRIERFLRAYLNPEQVTRATSILDDDLNLKRHCRRPFVLRTFAYAFDSPQGPASSVPELYGRFVQNQLEELEGFSAADVLERIEDALASLAYAMSSKGFWGVPAPMTLITKEPTISPLLSTLQYVSSTSVLDISPDGLEIAFEHQILQEHFASQYISSHMPEIDLNELVSDPAWTEVIVLCAGQYESPIAFLKMLIANTNQNPASKILASKVIHEYGLEDSAEGKAIIGDLAELINFEQIPFEVNSEIDAKRIYTAVDSIVALSRFHENERGVESICLAVVPDNTWIQQVALHALASAPEGSLASRSLVAAMRNMPLVPSRFIPKADLDARYLVLLRDKLERLLQSEIGLLPEELRRELRFRRRLRFLSDYRAWAIPIVFAATGAFVLLVANAAYDLFNIEPPLPIIGWFNQRNLARFGVPLVAVYIGAYTAMIGILMARDNREKIKHQLEETFNRETWSGIWSLSWKQRLQFGGMIILTLLVASFSFWMIHSYRRLNNWLEVLLDTEPGSTAALLLCGSAMVAMLLLFLVVVIKEQRWFYHRLRERQLGVMLFEGVLPEGPLVKDTPRRSLGSVAAGSCSLALLGFILGGVLMGRVIQDPGTALALACALSIAFGFPVAIIAASGVRELARFAKQSNETLPALRHFERSVHTDLGILRKLADIATNDTMHSSIRARALGAIGSSPQSTIDILEAIEPLVSSKYPRVRSAAAQASYQVRRRLNLPILYVDDAS